MSVAPFSQVTIVGLGLLGGSVGLSVQAHMPGVRVIGYDDVEIGTYVRPSLSSVHQPREEIAQLACDRLVGLLPGSA